MKKILKYFLLIAILSQSGLQQLNAKESFKGFPDAESAKNLKEKFQNPPKGYGNVPFYWWDGDSLVKQRLSDQLDILSAGAVDGFAVSYMHTHADVDVELNSKGHGNFGKADPGKPGVFTDEWWEIWNWFAKECADKGIGLGLDDYVVGWEKNGYYVDEILQDPSFRNYKGRLQLKKHTLKPGENSHITLENDPISVTIYPLGKDLISRVKKNELDVDNNTNEEQTVYIVYASPSHELHPQYGNRIVEGYFNQFDERLDDKAKESLNYFFQDELHYNLNIKSWAEDMPEEFYKRKGYDIRPYLPAMFENIGDVTPKARLDYADVVTQLAEERYFKPIFDWHNDRGLIYGCDNNGRGLAPLQYMDYFRMTSWFTAPGNDAPARGSSFRQTKVSSSISHLYNRPRTWLEAFHSMGWDSNGQWLTSQLDHHMLAGGNLLCMHGLYYSTHGGWWEWAPPCFHFRMPYWPHMKKWLEYAERLSYLLSQGAHVCDIAVLYPTESLQAYPDTKLDRIWQLAELLTSSGLDYDFIDYHSLSDAKIENGDLEIGKERYKILILPDVKAMHFSTLEKILEFSRKGGIVLATDDSLLATTRKGENDEEALKMWHTIFDNTSGHSQFAEIKNIPELIRDLITPDFTTSQRKGRVLHRRVDDRDIYMVMNVEKGEKLFFRSKGKVELWNAKDGSVTDQPIERQDTEGTWITFEGEPNTSSLFVFSPGEPKLANESNFENILLSTTPLDDEWDIEIVPTMDNKWGDFRLPASNGLIGPEAREFNSRFIGNSAYSDKVITDLYGYGPFMEMKVLDKNENLDAFLKNGNLMNDTTGWEPYVFSWQYGVKDSPGSQGYHGLKGKLDNRFLILDRGGHQVFRTYVYAPSTGMYVTEKEGVEPSYIILDDEPVYDNHIKLKRGWHSLIVAYAETPKDEYKLEEKRSHSLDNRQRSAVVFYPENHSSLKNNDPYGPIIASKWFDSQHLPYSAVKGRGAWEYKFKTAPATEQMTIKVKGKIASAEVDGKEIKGDKLKRLKGNEYLLTLDAVNDGVQEVTLIGLPEPGYEGAAFFTDPITLICGNGKLKPGNWSEAGALKYFSGGIKYKKTIHVPELNDKRMELDLGLVDATCEISVNGQPVDVLISPPYRLDITDFVESGENIIEVLVYSTLSNHYQSVPSAYRGKPRAGLIGPVSLKTYYPVKNN